MRRAEERREAQSDRPGQPPVSAFAQLAITTRILSLRPSQRLARTVSTQHLKTKGSPYSIAERGFRTGGSQSAGDVSHKPAGRLPLHSVRPAVTIPTLKTAATNFSA